MFRYGVCAIDAGLGASVGLANPGYVFDVRVDEG
jgi:hypothetical protein